MVGMPERESNGMGAFVLMALYEIPARWYIYQHS
jgi:hypothetical protein